MLTDSEGDLAPAGMLGGLEFLAVELHTGVAGQIGSAGQKSRLAGKYRIEALLERLPSRDLVSGLERGEGRVPAGDPVPGVCGIPFGG